MFSFLNRSPFKQLPLSNITNEAGDPHKGHFNQLAQRRAKEPRAWWARLNPGKCFKLRPNIRLLTPSPAWTVDLFTKTSCFSPRGVSNQKSTCSPSSAVPCNAVQSSPTKWQRNNSAEQLWSPNMWEIAYSIEPKPKQIQIIIFWRMQRGLNMWLTSFHVQKCYEYSYIS